MAEKQGILSEAEAAAERAKLRNTLKAEFQKKLTHPFRHGHGEGGFVVFIFLSNQFQPHWLEFVNHNVLSTFYFQFDPAVQRFMSMNASHLDYFKVTPKTTRYGLMLSVIPFLCLGYIIQTQRV